MVSQTVSLLDPLLHLVLWFSNPLQMPPVRPKTRKFLRKSSDSSVQQHMFEKRNSANFTYKKILVIIFQSTAKVLGIVSVATFAHVVSHERIGRSLVKVYSTEKFHHAENTSGPVSTRFFHKKMVYKKVLVLEFTKNSTRNSTNFLIKSVYIPIKPSLHFLSFS